MEGKLTKLDKQGRGCLIDGQYYEIAENVNIDFVKEGDVEFKAMDNSLVFVKPKAFNKPATGFKTNYSKSNYPPKQDDKAKVVSMFISYAKDLVIADKIELNQMEEYVDGFISLYERKLN